MKRVILIYIILVADCILALGQSNDQQAVHFMFEGQTKSKESYLRKQILEDQTYLSTDSVIQVNTQRLLNLPNIFSLDKVYQQDTLIFFIKEKKTLLPVMNFGGIKDNFWSQMGISDFNFRGMGQQVVTYYQYNDRRHTAELYYKIPQLKDPRWGLFTNYLHWESVEPLFFDEGPVSFNYTNNAAGASIIRNLDYQNSLDVGFVFFRESYSKTSEQVLSNPPGPNALIQNKYLVRAEFASNNLNYNNFYLSDYLWRINYQYVFNFSDQTNFHSVIFEGRYFYRLNQLVNFAVRGRFGISTNNNSPFAPFVVDSQVNIRGVGNRIDRGTAQLVINLEYRHTILDVEHWGSQFVIFADNGSWRNPGGELSDLIDQALWRQFIGLGLRIIYKRTYNAIIRLDYGIDIHNIDQRGFVIGGGQYF